MLFWVFDADGNGSIEHKELAVGLEMLKESAFDDKLDKFFEICDEDNSGSIEKKEFYRLLKETIIEYEDKLNLRSYVNEIFNILDVNGTGKITKTRLR